MILCILCTAEIFAFTGSDEPSQPGPVADSILEKQRDSVLIQLNLDYLNGVNKNHDPFELIPIIEEILVLDPAQYNHWFNLGMERIKIREYEQAIKALNEGLEIFPTDDYTSLIKIQISLSYCYHKIDKHKQEKEILDEISLIHPDHPGVVGRYAVCAHARMRNREADHYRDQLVTILKKEGVPEPEIAFYLGRLYLNTDHVEAEKYFRKAFYYDPDDVEKMGALAWVLIMNTLTLNEGMQLIEKAIAADPNNAVFIHRQGYGFFVKGNYENALFNLYKARDLYEEYNFDLIEHIRLAEESLASIED